MKKKDLHDALGKIDDELIEETGQSRKEPHKASWFSSKILPVAVVLMVIFGVYFVSEGNLFNNNVDVDQSLQIENEVLANADYPDTLPKPNVEDYVDSNGNFNVEKYNADLDDWENSLKVLVPENEAYADNYYNFLTKVNPVFTQDRQENFVYSPLNIYFATSMLVETTEGNSQLQLLNLLGLDSLDNLRSSITDLWKTNYADNPNYKSLLANSIWLQKDSQYKQVTLDILKDTYFASVYSGEFGSQSYDQDIKNWINASTFDLLKDNVANFESSELTRMALVSSIYYKNSWVDNYDSKNNIDDTFESPTGQEQVTYMTSSHNGQIVKGDGYLALSKDLSGDYMGFDSLIFIRPNDDKSVEDILSHQDFKGFLTGLDTNDLIQPAKINEYIPKFDVTSTMDVIDTYKQLGVTDIFDSHTADLSRISDDDLFVSMIEHNARFIAEEDGVEAGAYTVIAVEETAAIDEPEEINFKLNKPFIFILRNDQNVPVFVGIVNNPNK